VIRTVIILQNGMVMVFDGEGEQMPEYQGQYERMREDILSDAPPEAVFACWFNGNAEPDMILREGW